jgi:hypothetical protein
MLKMKLGMLTDKDEVLVVNVWSCFEMWGFFKGHIFSIIRKRSKNITLQNLPLLVMSIYPLKRSKYPLLPLPPLRYPIFRRKTPKTHILHIPEFGAFSKVPPNVCRAILAF